MRLRNAVIVLALAVFAGNAFAQRFELYGDYSYFQFNPAISGLQSRSLNGGGGGAQLNFAKLFGLKADFQGYLSDETAVNISSPIGAPGGVVPAGTYTSNATTFTYLFGPVVRIPLKIVTPFGEVLFGGMHTKLYTQLNSAAIANGGQINSTSTQHPFAMAVGGGLDINFSKRVALRLVEVDWFLSRFSNIWTDTNNQNNFRYLGGFVFRFGD